MDRREVAWLGGHTRMPPPKPPQATERKEEEWAGEQSGKMGLNVDYQAKKDGSAGASRQA